MFIIAYYCIHNIVVKYSAIQTISQVKGSDFFLLSWPTSSSRLQPPSSSEWFEINWHPQRATIALRILRLLLIITRSYSACLAVNLFSVLSLTSMVEEWLSMLYEDCSFSLSATCVSFVAVKPGYSLVLPQLIWPFSTAVGKGQLLQVLIKLWAAWYNANQVVLETRGLGAPWLSISFL